MRNISIHLTLVGLMLLTLVSNAKATASSTDSALVDWVREYGSGLPNATDGATAITTDASGNVYVTGRSSNASYKYDYLTIKYSSSGNSLWEARYSVGPLSDNRPVSLCVDHAGNVYVTGLSSDSTAYYSFATVKYDSMGVQKWVARYLGADSGNCVPTAIAVDRTGNVYVTGSSPVAGTVCTYTTIKYSSDGIQKWVAMYNGPGNGDDKPAAIAVDSAENVYVTGRSYGSNTGYDFATIKYDSTGLQQWAARYDGPANDWDEATALALDDSGNVYVTGLSYATDTGFDYATIKYSTLGKQEWVARYNGSASDWDEATALALDGSGNIYVTGLSYVRQAGNDGYATVKYDREGTLLWVDKYDGPADGWAYAASLVVDADGNAYVAGYSTSASAGGYYLTVKYDSSGVRQWVAKDANANKGSSVLVGMAIDGSGNLYVTGSSKDNDQSVYRTIKYAQVPAGTETDVKPIATPESFSLNQNYPNPFNPSTTIKYQLAKQTDVALTVYSVSGQLVRTLVSGAQQPGYYTIQWNGLNNAGEQVSSGVYFYRLAAGNQASTKKMMLLK